DLFRVMTKEVTVGLLNGLIIGLLLGGFVYFWQHNLGFAVLITFAVNMNMVIAVILGGCIPLAARRIGVDPAVASPMITTVMDMCGFMLTLGLAALFIAYHAAGV
ncbi:MAG TPA: magnesium transporter, partial [candidate division Zixibacteria bacterium]|nr:magnesium transporter [candidate division Zixibacteria bacterium]